MPKPFALCRLAPFLVYLLLAILLTWPLARHFTTHVPGDGIDDPALAWNLWWVRHRLVDQLSLDIFHCDWMFHPVAINLAFYTLTPLNGLLSTPLQLALGLVSASNLILLSSYTVAGLGAYLLVMNELGTIVKKGQAKAAHLHFVAFFAGLVYAFASPKLFYASLGQFNIASSQWLPFCALYMLRTGRSTQWRVALRNGVWAGLFFAFQAWAELTYASFLLTFIACAALFTGLQALRQRRAANWLLGMAALGALSLASLAPFLLAMAPDLRSQGDFWSSGGGFADIFSADLFGYLLPTRLHPWLGQWTANQPFPNDKGQQIFLGYSVMILLGFAAWGDLRRLFSPYAHNSERKKWLPGVGDRGFWWLMLLLFALLTLGPALRWRGVDLPIPGPFLLISQLPFFSGNRYPSRYGVMLLLCAAVLAAWGLLLLLDWLAKRSLASTGRGLLLAVSLFFLLEHLAVPLPLNDFRIPPVYQRIAQTPGEFAVLELPTGWRNGARVLGKSDVLIMMQQWYQTLHGKQRLGGNTSRNPEQKFQYFSEAPLLGDLIALMNADDQAHAHLQAEINQRLERMIAEGKRIAPAVLDFLNVRYVTLHVEKSSPALLRFVAEALPVTLLEEWQGLDWRGAPATIRLYTIQNTVQTPGAPAPRNEFDLSAAGAALYLSSGWSPFVRTGQARFATQPQAELLLDLADDTQTLAIDYWGNRPPALLVNAQSALAAVLEPQRVVFTLPPGASQATIDRLVFDFGNSPLSVELLPAASEAGGWPIGATGGYLTASHALGVRSAGEEVGDFAHIYLDGVDIARNERGYNLVALNSKGVLLGAAVFDTHLDSTASAALAAWVRQWPGGVLIAGAVADTASDQLGQDALDALAGIGVAADLRGKFRWSHAFIGMVGAPPGSALEQIDLLRPASVFVGVPSDRGALYGGILRLHFFPSQ